MYDNMKGIYAYYDTKKEEIVYIGKDSHINEDRRHRQHLQPSNYDVQPFNRILQNNPNRYEYKRIFTMSDEMTKEDLNGLEIQYIEALNPKHNYTVGGEGCDWSKATHHKYWATHPMSEEHRKNIGLSHIKHYARIVLGGRDYKGTQKYQIKYQDKTMYGINVKELVARFNEKYPNIEVRGVEKYAK